MTIPVLLPESSSGQERAKLVWHYKRNKAQATQPITCMTSIYKHKLNYEVLDRHKHYKPHRRVGSNSSPYTYQRQYNTHWAPVTNMGHPHFHPGFKKASVTATKRSDIHCACCDICSDWKAKESLAEHFEGMYVCDVRQCCRVCNGTYHWSCLPRLGCYCARTGNPLRKDEAWACPACAFLTDSEKES